ACTAIVAGCLRPDPVERFQNMGDIKAAIERIRTSLGRAPSIAVLPFVNMSADPEDEFFSDGLSEEIIHAMARVPDLKVIARTSSFAFRGKQRDIREIAEQLGVSTILEGSVRRAGGRIRVMAELIDAADGYNLWSESF